MSDSDMYLASTSQDLLSAMKKKRRRSVNTSLEQYEEYLRLMENDYVFRSGIINPQSDSDYLKKKWIWLVDRLNSLGSGPHLPVEDWRKRFNDWKNCTRSKFRKLTDSRNRDDGDPNSKIKMTSLELRGLIVWGKDNVCIEDILELEENNYVQEDKIVVQVDSRKVPRIEPKVIINVEDDSCSSCKKLKTINELPVSEPVNCVAETIESKQPSESLQTTAQVMDILLKKYTEVEEKKLELESKKLLFEIAKYKFENKEFQFDL